MVNCSHHDKSGIRRMFALGAKVLTLVSTRDACVLPMDMYYACAARMIEGHREHADDGNIDSLAEAREELADAVNYAAIARLQGSWTWRWRVAAWLVGLAWRVLR